MKRVVNFLIVGLMLMCGSLFAQNQSTDRMQRDIAVMETALSQMIKQELDQRNFFFLDVKGNYVSGYGVTFTVPTGMFSSVWSTGGNEVVVVDGSISFSDDDIARREDVEITEREAHEAKEAMKNPKKSAQKDREKAERELQTAKQEHDRALQERTTNGYVYTAPNFGVATTSRRRYYNSDSVNAVNNTKIVNAAKTFIADYGDMLSQLAPDERIVVTNRTSQEGQFWFNGQRTKRSLLSVEAAKSDLTAFRQGKITREQLMAKIKVINTVTSEKSEPDIELLNSIFNRLYQADLSKTYYLQGNPYYERLTDFGAILHMQVYSSNTNYVQRGEEAKAVLSMPTLGLQNLTEEERNKKVKELYPVFESELKDNVLEYGRTLKSLNDNEQLIVDVTMTKCKGCGIPATLEVAVKASVLKDFNAGKLDKSAALSKIEVKKGPAQ